MYDDFFFPYEKAKLWTGNMFLLSLSNFLLYASLYMMLPVLPLWMVRHWYCSYAEAGAAIAVFGLAMFLPGTFNSYLIDTFKRKSVCFIAIFLFVASSLLYPYVATVGFVALVRAVQGGLFSVITMTTGSTLVIDVTASRRRTDANIAFAWAGRFGMVVGLALGIFIYPYWNFHRRNQHQRQRSQSHTGINDMVKIPIRINIDPQGSTLVIDVTASRRRTDSPDQSYEPYGRNVRI